MVLGSTQDPGLLNTAAVADLGAQVVRRRGGGGVVLLLPGDHLWFDAWIPRDDPLWRDDVSHAAVWAGEWWRDALETVGITGTTVHRGGAVSGPHPSICFSGRGPGEVIAPSGAKIMGLSQWRSREGALFHTCVYHHFDAASLVDLIALGDTDRAQWRQALNATAVGVEDLVRAKDSFATLTERLTATFANWAVPPTTPSH